jgi:pilus assembly protein CpaF
MSPSHPSAKEALPVDFGPLTALMQDPTITEIMVNGIKKVFVESRGTLKATPLSFSSEEELMKLFNKIAEFLGKNLSDKAPTLDGRLPDGSRVNLVIPPVSVDGPSMTIRKFSPMGLTYENLIASGMLDEKMAYFLNCCVSARINMIVSGGTGSGKTTLLNVLSSFIDPAERVVTIEDAAELKIQIPNLVRLEARPGDLRETPPVTIRQLAINALRMRPDRIIIGECRGAEALDMLFAMNTGHEGSMSTIHSNTGRDALRRIEAMVMLAGSELPLRTIREYVSSALQLVVNVQRGQDGVRRIVEMIEVSGMEGEVITTQDIFKYNPKEKNFVCAGFVPRFIQKFALRGIQFPPDFFSLKYKITKKT